MSFLHWWPGDRYVGIGGIWNWSFRWTSVGCMLRYSLLFACLIRSRRGTHWADCGHGSLSDARDVRQRKLTKERSIRSRSRPSADESSGQVGWKAPPVGPDTVGVALLFLHSWERPPSLLAFQMPMQRVFFCASSVKPLGCSALQLYKDFRFK